MKDRTRLNILVRYDNSKILNKVEELIIIVKEAESLTFSSIGNNPTSWSIARVGRKRSREAATKIEGRRRHKGGT